MLTVANLKPGRWRVTIAGTALFSWPNILVLVGVPVMLVLVIVPLVVSPSMWPALIPLSLCAVGLLTRAVYGLRGTQIRPASLTHGSEQREAADHAIQLYQSIDDDALHQAARWLAIAIIRKAWLVEEAHRRITELNDPAARAKLPVAKATRTTLLGRRPSMFSHENKVPSLQSSLLLFRQQITRRLALLQELRDHDHLRDVDHSDHPLL